MNSHKDIPELDRHGLRRFVLTLAGIIAVLFGIVLPWIVGGAGWPVWPWILSVVLAVWGVVAPSSTKLLYWFWMRLGLVLNAIMSRVVLGVVFYLAVLPTGIIMRLTGRDPLHRDFDREAPTYRVASERRSPNHMEKPY